MQLVLSLKLLLLLLEWITLLNKKRRVQNYSDQYCWRTVHKTISYMFNCSYFTAIVNNMQACHSENRIYYMWLTEKWEAAATCCKGDRVFTTQAVKTGCTRFWATEGHWSWCIWWGKQTLLFVNCKQPFVVYLQVYI